MKNLLYLGIVGLVLLAAVLGYAMYQQQTLSKTPTTTPKPIQQIQSQATPKPKESSVDEENLIEENLIRVALEISPQEDKNTYYQKLLPFAKDTDIVEIINCKPFPLVLNTKDGMVLKIKNNDSIDHNLLGGKDELKLPAGSTISTKIGQFYKYNNFTCVGGSQGIWLQ